MKRFIILKQKMFEKTRSFEDRINEKQGYEAISISNDGAFMTVLMKRTM
jgi:hypothetical protein